MNSIVFVIFIFSASTGSVTNIRTTSFLREACEITRSYPSTEVYRLWYDKIGGPTIKPILIECEEKRK